MTDDDMKLTIEHLGETLALSVSEYVAMGFPELPIMTFYENGAFVYRPISWEEFYKGERSPPLTSAVETAKE